MAQNIECEICNGNADSIFKWKVIWSNERWKLSISCYKVVKGFSYLEPVDHIESIDKLNDDLSREFGFLLVKFTKMLKEILKVKLVYIYIFGDHISHLHAHLAPHTEGDYLYSDIVKPDVQFPEELMTEKEFENIANTFRRIMD
jgi:diadenosine tetraphosphate (Ap4A) HIT family hydrolase